MKKYDAMYFIKKFEAIPKEKWTVASFVDKNGNCCALGHCGMGLRPVTNEALALQSIFNKNVYVHSVTTINDGFYEQSKMLGNNPKERVLNALYLINAMEEDKNVESK